MDVKNRQKLERVEADLNKILAACAREGDRGLTVAEKKRFEALESEHDHLIELIETKEGQPFGARRLSSPIAEFSTEEMRDRFRTRPGDRSDRRPEDRAFSNFLRVGMEGLAPDDREIMQGRFSDGSQIKNAQTTMPGSGGGYTVPQGFSYQLEKAMKWFGGIEGTVGEFETETGAPMPWPTVNDTGNMGRMIGENVQVTETDFVFNQVTFQAYIMSSDLVLIPRSLMEDSAFDIDALAAELLGTRLGRLLNQKCTVGSGSNEPTGIVTASVAAGLVTQLLAGNTASISYSNLVDLEHAVDPAYRENGTWMFSDAMLRLLKKLVDGNGRPLWQPGLTASFGDGAAVIGSGRPLILGHPYAINSNMAVPAANAYSVLFGDMSRFKRRKVGQPTVLRLVERYADYLQVGFIAYLRTDSNLIDAGTHPIAVLQQSAM